MLSLQSAVVCDLVYHTAMHSAATETGGCSGVFHHSQPVWSALRTLGQLLVDLVPLWTIIGVFGEEPNSGRHYDILSDTSSEDDGRRHGVHAAETMLPELVTPFAHEDPFTADRRELGAHIRHVLATTGGRVIVQGRRAMLGRRERRRLNTRPSRAAGSALEAIHEERSRTPSFDE